MKYVKLAHTGTDVSAIDLCVAPVIVSAAQEVDIVEQPGETPKSTVAASRGRRPTRSWLTEAFPPRPHRGHHGSIVG